MARFKPGDRVLRKNKSNKDVIQGNTYIVESCNEYNVKLVSISDTYDPNFFELVEPKVINTYKIY